MGEDSYTTSATVSYTHLDVYKRQAEEVAKGVPTTVVAASRNRGAAEFVQDILMNPTFRIYVNDDVMAVSYTHLHFFNKADLK